MIQRLVARRADALVDMGRTIFARLEADPRLVDAAGSMKATQNGLEPKVDALDSALSAERLARAQRDEERRRLTVELREIGFMLLSGNGNHHNADPYLKYFPDGYGEVMQFPSTPLGEFGRLVITHLDEETDAKLLAHREFLEQSLDRFLAAEDVYQTALRARKEAFALVQAEKRNWSRGVVLARALAEAACHYEPAYIRLIFAPIAKRRRVVAEEEAEITEVPDAENVATVMNVQAPDAEPAFDAAA